MKIISIDNPNEQQKHLQHSCIGCRRPINLTATITFMCTKCKNYFCEECAYYFNEFSEKTSNFCPGSKEIAIGKHAAVLAKITRTIKESNPIGVSIAELERSTKSRIIEKPTIKIIDQDKTATTISSAKIIDNTVALPSDTTTIGRPIKKTNKRQPVIIDDDTKAEKK